MRRAPSERGARLVVVDYLTEVEPSKPFKDYRLAVKWGWFAGAHGDATRRRLKSLKWAMTAFFLALGLATLAAYIKIGIEHAPRAGEPYTPAWVQPALPAPK